MKPDWNLDMWRTTSRDYDLDGSVCSLRPDIFDDTLSSWENIFEASLGHGCCLFYLRRNYAEPAS